MVRAWFIDEKSENPRDEHQRCPPKFITLEELYKTSGVEYNQITVENYMLDPTLRKLIEEREMKGQDLVEDLDPSDLAKHFVEHFHTYDEFRMVLEGCGYFDVRDKYDEWIRVELLPGDLIVIPGGCYHRFTVEAKNIYKGVRFLKDGVYQAHNRPMDGLVCRKQYVKRLYNGAFDGNKENE